MNIKIESWLLGIFFRSTLYFLVYIFVGHEVATVYVILDFKVYSSQHILT